MNTNKLKTFAKEARLILMEGVAQRLEYWGFDKKGKLVEELETIDGGYIFRGDAFNDTTVPAKWKRLVSAVKRHSAKDIIEEAAYTWFNRLIAIKILEQNNYIDPVIKYISEDLAEPIILDKARKGHHEKLREAEKETLRNYLLDGNKDEEAFALLLIAYCRNQKLLKKVFGHIDDYTELLIPNNLLSGGGIIEHINESEAIEEEDYKEVELIGWLYQFYISDKKDEVFAGFKQKKKARAEDIPAATQIFTPKWIVKYMVENTVGRIWLDKNPGSPIHDEMKYLVEPADKENYKPEPIINDVTELTLLDPACGSGHILVVGFDLLMKMYMEEGYSTRNAVESIITKNLYGLDIDDRAAQLANFAILLKAAKYYVDILEKDIETNIFSMPEPQQFSKQDIYDYLGEKGREYLDELEIAIEEMQLAKNIGSALKLKLSKEAHNFIAIRNNEKTEHSLFGNLKPFVDVILILTAKYHSVVANPPYMGQKNMNGPLKNFIDQNYPISRSDIFSVFIELMINLTLPKSRMGCITMEAWMFLSSYEKLRYSLLDKYTIISLSHFGWHIIGIAFGTAALILEKSKKDFLGEYSYLTIEDIDRKRNIPHLFPNTNNKKYSRISQNNFFKIPGSQIAYWLSDKIVNIFATADKLNDYSKVRTGLQTGDNSQFVRYWHEVSKLLFGLNLTKQNAAESNYKWFPYNKGGEQKRWYGNAELVVDWKSDGLNIKDKKTNDLMQGKITANNSHCWNEILYFNESISWSKVTSSKISFRYYPRGFIFDVGGCSVFPFEMDQFKFFLGLLNSKVVRIFLAAISPTVNFEPGQIKQIPIIFADTNEINTVVNESVNIAKTDWDSRETSWEFKLNPIIEKSNSLIEASLNNWTEEASADFFQLHKNEEELNKIFIEIYGLEDELTPEVELKDITILQEETFIDDNNNLVFREDVIIQQLISYSIGCMFGRYRLDKEGLQVAHPNPTAEEIASYKITSPLHNGTKEVTFEIDDDAIIPLMGSDSPFSDDIYLRVKHFVEIVWGAETLTENLNFINECLDMELEKFLTEKFWQFHCKMYKKTPIYWLFSSPKGAFKVLVYMHRMNKYTAQKIRNNYLLKHLQYLRSEISRLEKNESGLTRQETKRLDKLRVDELECREYDVLVKDIADKQIEFDLDDGVKNNYQLFEDIVAPIK